MLTRREFLKAAGIAGVVAPGQLRHARVAQVRPSETPQPGDERIVEGIRLKWCPPGQFTMGSPVSEVGHRADEAQVPVTIARGFWLATFETMQGEWRRIVGDFPERPPSPEFGIGDAVPVYWVNFAAAEGFARRATELARRSGAIDETLEFRLPTEAQWEYGCRAGTTTATAFGDSLSRSQANFSGEPLNGGRGGPAAGRATAVGRYPPNAWGLCDMHGNIFEWCRDWYHPRLPGGIDPDLSGTKGAPNRDGSYSRVRRGGAWNDPGWACRSALRLRYEPERSSDHIGFRVALVRMA